MTMTKAEIADQVMWLLKNGDDTLTLEEEVEEIAFLLDQCQEQGASRKTINAAFDLAVQRLRDGA